MNKSWTVGDIAMAQEKENDMSNYRLQVLGNEESKQLSKPKLLSVLSTKQQIMAVFSHQFHVNNDEF